MLVLNTNQGSNRAFTVSNNHIIRAYPDFENSLLMFPINFTSYSNTTPIFSVGGTPVHQLCGTIADINYYQTSSGDDSEHGMLFDGGTGSVVASKRVSFEESIGGGITVGKNIIVPRMLGYNVNASSISSIKITVEILHSDGTITKVGEKQLEGNWASTNIGNYTYDNGIFSVIQTAGVTTVAGDRVAFSYEVTASKVYAQNQTWASFGKIWTNDYRHRLCPLQISID